MQKPWAQSPPADTDAPEHAGKAFLHAQSPEPTALKGRSQAPRPRSSAAGRRAREQIVAGARGSFAFLWRAHNSGGLACGGLRDGQSKLSLHSDTVHLPLSGTGRAAPRVGVARLRGAWGSGPRATSAPYRARPLHAPGYTRGGFARNSALPGPGKDAEQPRKSKSLLHYLRSQVLFAGTQRLQSPGAWGMKL